MRIPGFSSESADSSSVPISIAVMVAAALAFTFAFGSGACGTSPIGVDSCRTVEDARCRAAPSCSDIDLSMPVHITSESDVDACIAFYNDQCLHGLVAGDPGAVEVNQCAAAIAGGDGGVVDCTIVEHPEMSPYCYWLIPPADVDAGEDADASEDAADAADSE